MFADRHDAGRRLAALVAGRRYADPVVVALPRGGVPVGAELADALAAPLDVLIVRKLGCPWQPELGFGALAEGGVRLLNQPLVARLELTSEEIDRITAEEQRELDRRVRRYRGDRAPVPVDGRTAILVDDGLATGFTARAGIDVLRGRGATRVVLAAPVLPAEALDSLREVADEVVFVEAPAMFRAIGDWYEDFRQTSDEEVTALLRAAGGRGEQPSPDGGVRPVRTREVKVPAGHVHLQGTLTVPPSSEGVVIFAHGSGSSRLSPRNRAVADTLNRGGLATLLFDLLTIGEALERSNVFHIDLLAHRLVQATRWVAEQPETANLPIGYFGASTGAAAALQAAADLDGDIAAIVSRGGRPDLASRSLPSVTAPTLLVVGANDPAVLDLTHRARELFGSPTAVEVVPGATHLFDEPGALEAVADLALAWFTTHLRSPDPAGPGER